MMPQTLLMAYEENGRVMPVVSDFDCFLVGTRGVQFRNSLPEDQVDLMHEMISGIERFLKEGKEEMSESWKASWLNVMKQKYSHVTMPKYGFGCPKSYEIMKHAVRRPKEFGAVRPCCKHPQLTLCRPYLTPPLRPFLVELKNVSTSTSLKKSMMSFLLLGELDRVFPTHNTNI